MYCWGKLTRCNSANEKLAINIQLEEKKGIRKHNWIHNKGNYLEGQMQSISLILNKGTSKLAQSVNLN